MYRSLEYHLIKLVHSLGVDINWSQVEGPAQLTCTNLQNACQVVRGGPTCTFLRHILDAMNKLSDSSLKIRLDASFHHDIQWWVTHMSTFNGTAAWPHPQPITNVYADACNTGGGTIFSGDYCHIIKPASVIQPEQHSHKSTTCPEVRNNTERQILSEITEGHYKIIDHKPKIVSALGSITKCHSDKIRLIHDGSLQIGNFMNLYTKKF